MQSLAISEVPADDNTGGAARVPTEPLGKIPTQLGWIAIPHTAIANVCAATHGFPGIGGASRCAGIFAWSGGIADTRRNRLLIWGGGHNDYYGNEIYSLNLNDLSMTRLNDPSPQTPCQAATSDGKANTRHTYGGLAYIEHADKMYVVGGSNACPDGHETNDTWMLDVGNLAWARMDVSQKGGPLSGQLNGKVASYDAASRLVFLNDREHFWSYRMETNTYTLLDAKAENTLHTNSVIDPKRKMFFTFGDRDVAAYSLDPQKAQYGKQQDWSNAKGCSGLAGSPYPGLAYDPAQDRIVGWAGGDTVYLFNPDTRACSTATFPGGPGAQREEGTHGRFRYFPALGVFVLVNDWEQDAYVLRMTPAPGAQPQ